MKIIHLAWSSIAALLCLGGGTAHAFCTQVTVGNIASVKEYYDSASDRYFLSRRSVIDLAYCGDPQTIREPPPSRTTPTALEWGTLTYAERCSARPGSPLYCEFAQQVCVFRADGQAEPASRFFTINRAECAALQQPGSGWTYEPSYIPGSTGVAPLSAFELDSRTGACPANLVPVYRFVNNRWGEMLGNHRYLADEAVRREMRGRAGWTEEGVAFCVPSAYRNSIATLPQNFASLAHYPPSAASCENGFGIFNLCIEAANMPPPRTAHWLGTAAAMLPFFEKTGALESRGFAVTHPFATDAETASHSFFQIFLSSPGAGFFVSSADRSSGYVSSLRSRTVYLSTAFTEPLAQPFVSIYEVDMDLSIAYRLFVRRARAEGAGNEAYVQPLVTFRDAHSGRRLTVSPGAVGTVSMADLATRDAATGDILVSIVLGQQTSVGRSLGLPSLRTPKRFDSENPWGWGGDFIYRVNRTEFARVIDRARAIDPSLSSDPDHYVVESFGIKGEVVGDSEIGYNFEKLEISLVRP